MKKLGWRKMGNNFFVFLFDQKLVHILVIAITGVLLIINLAPNTSAEGFTDGAQKTILADLIRSEFSEFEEDEQLIVETFSSENVISSIEQSYLDNLSAFRPQLKVDPLEENEDEEEDDFYTTQDGASLVKPNIASTEKIKRKRTETVVYKIEPGDSISTIAEQFEISVATILWENDLSVYSVIRPGQELRILPTSGLNHVVKKNENLSSIATQYKIEGAVIVEANKLADNSTLQIGQKIFIPGGKKISLPVYKPTTYSGIAAIKNIVTAPDSTPAPSNKMNWPADTTRITQYYSWRHTGLDLASKTGTAIYAADAGTIEMLGWGTGYGNQIVIDHGGGKKTRYAHLSKFFVEKGEKINKGQTIAAMGSTGWSTGSHLHFEVIINNSKYNPLNYIR